LSLMRNPNPCLGPWILCFLLALALACRPIGGRVDAGRMAGPAERADGWEKTGPFEAGFDAGRLDALISGLMAGGSNIHCVLVERHGRLVVERYQNGKDRTNYSLFAHPRAFGPSDRQDVRSVGKSVINLLLGIARGQGRLGSLATPVVDFFPEYPELATPARKAITVEHLLAMSSGLKWSQEGGLFDDEHRLAWTGSPCRFVLSRPVVAVPGTRYQYSSGDNTLLAEILTRVTGMPWEAFARKELFEPLGITDWEWVADPRGRPMSYSGLRMRPRDMAKLGLLVVNHGQWKGRQLIPADWLEASLRPRMATGVNGLGYGHQWWTGTVDWRGKPLAWGAAFGNGSQRIFVVPALDLCVVVTAGAYGDLRVAGRVNGFLRDLVGTIRE
jgi:CubicO group peptidase (beta-lactamase class C family)